MKLKKVVTGAGTVEFVYDPSGRRAAKIVNGVTTRYVWDGDQLIAETNALGNILREYGYGLDIDEPLYQEDYQTHETVFFHQDFQYSTAALTDSSGSLKESYDYDAFGKLISAKDAAGRFTKAPYRA